MKLIGNVLRNLFMKPFTRKYPDVKPEIPTGFRGKVIHYPERCIYCGLCAKYCPSGAIKVNVKKKIWSYDWGKCTFCGQCQEICHEIPKKDAIRLTKEYELAGKNRKEFSAKDRYSDTVYFKKSHARSSI